ncbi:hypothetical protein NEOLEDRAFT_1178452 [Neolentinus lepideus HHB14362 ss-1]|uniref:MFS general substrate transporter n=1 Tax=Neolentinus lepideus HHB14362 ss-1 TaxID=1314782 RepID=A0A165SLH8_9AGAM|nr:hypothetical protein NEOLEDRAFT_1178452 [Neolentinus lepideus HHB14362 ss-1]
MTCSPGCVLVQRGEGDNQHPLRVHGALLPWLDALTNVLTMHFPIVALLGFHEALDLTSLQFCTLIAAYYVGQIPPPLLTRLTQQTGDKWLVTGPVSALMLGTVSILMGFTTNFSQAVLARALLSFLSVTLSLFKGDLLNPAWVWPPEAWTTPLVHVIGLGQAAMLVCARSEGELWWLTEPEKHLVARWKMEQDQQWEAANAPVEAVTQSSIHIPYTKILCLGFAHAAVGAARSYEQFWPLITIAVVGIDKPGLGMMTLISAPWLVPGSLLVGLTWCWKKLMCRCASFVVQVLFVSVFFPWIAGFAGLQILATVNVKGWLVLSLFLTPLTSTSNMAYQLNFWKGMAELLEAIPPGWKRAARSFMFMCSTIGTILGCYFWRMSDGVEPFYQMGAFVSAMCLGQMLPAFTLCMSEYLSTALHHVKMQVAENPTKEMDMVLKHEQLL